MTASDEPVVPVGDEGSPDLAGALSATNGADRADEQAEVAARGFSLPPRAVAGWLALLLVLTALDGVVGAALAVGVAAVLLAGFPGRLLALLGVAAWVAVPVVVLVRGLPARGEVAPAFAVDDLLAHHLAFAGFALLVVAALVSRGPRPAAVAWLDPEGGPLGRLAVAARWALIGVVAVLAVVATAVVVTR